MVPPATDLDPLIETITAGTPLVRIHPSLRGPLEFNPTAASSRFRPVVDDGGAIVPTAYVAMDLETALTEVLLRGVSQLQEGTARRRLYRLELDGLEISRLRVRRALRVVRLHGVGLTRLGVLREDLIDTPASEYAYTAQWATSLYGTAGRPHGLCWTSRQNDSARALMLWRTRLTGDELELEAPRIPLDRASGLDLVRKLCADAGVDLEG